MAFDAIVLIIVIMDEGSTPSFSLMNEGSTPSFSLMNEGSTPSFSLMNEGNAVDASQGFSVAQEPNLSVALPNLVSQTLFNFTDFRSRLSGKVDLICLEVHRYSMFTVAAARTNFVVLVVTTARPLAQPWIVRWGTQPIPGHGPVPSTRSL